MVNVIVIVIVDSIVNVNNLIPQHPRHIGDMHPSVILLGDELGEADGVGSLHVYDKGKEHRIILDASCGDIRRTPHDMVTVGDSAHGGIECRAAVARGDDDGCAVAAAYGVEQLLYKDGEHPLCRTGRRVVDGQALGGRALYQLLYTKILHDAFLIVWLNHGLRRLLG